MMPLQRRYIQFIGLLLLLMTTGLAAFRLPDNGFIDKVVAALNRYNEYYRQDKLYVHTDKNYYASGETIWMKAYQVDAVNHVPHSKSKVVYVDLVDGEDKVLASQKLKVENGVAPGDITLPAEIPSGTYTLRAYTRWMLNADKAYLFTTPLQIINSNDQLSKPVAALTEAAIDLQFFPEGGYLVHTLPAVVAFKAINKQGKGVEVQGVITEESGDTVTTFQSLHLGMGTFRLEPQAGKQYIGSVQLPDSTIARFPLPVVQAIGWGMSVDNSANNSIHVKLYSTATKSAQVSVSTQATVIAQVRGTVVYSATASLAEKPADISISKDKLPEGIVHITAFNEEGNALCERLVYVQKQEYLQMQVSTDKKVYAPREKVTMDITVKDKEGNPVAANLSIAVTNASLLQTSPYGSNIVNHFLLTSDLKGYIEEPGYYFSTDSNARKALDVLMMTQGWRRFVWKEILKDTQPELVYDTEDGISLSGRLMDPSTKNPVSNQLITLSIPGGNPAFVQQYTDVQGYFYFTDLNYQDDKEIYLQSVGATLSKPMQFIIDTVVAMKTLQAPLLLLPEKTIDQFVTKSRSREKIMTAFAMEDGTEASSGADSGSLPLNNRPAIVDVPADHAVNLDNYNEFPDMVETLKEIVPGILIKNKKGTYKLQVLDIKRKLYFKNEPVYFIDGLLMSSNDAFLKLDPGTVQTIEVYGRPEKLARFETLGKNGVLAAYTRNSDYTPGDNQGLLRFNFKGYSPVREFYAPLYDVATGDHHQPDLRPLTYWNPQIVTDANGKAQLTFYNGDTVVVYQIDLQGISSKGIPGTSIITYQVKLPLQSQK